MDSFNMIAATGCYLFKINHSKTKDMNIGECITSPKFRVGQHDWVVEYYPQGDEEDNNGKYVSIFLVLQSVSIPVRAMFEFALLDKQGNVSPSTLRKSELPETFTSHENCICYEDFFERDKLEETYVNNGYFELFVKITVKDESCPGERWNTISNGFQDERERLQTFMKEKKCTDVSFNVNGKIFVAHRLILAVNSPVFEELFGLMTESNIDCNCITISEMIPSVFKKMLDFMYSGSLSVNEELADCEGTMSSTTFLQNLLAVADRYAVERLQAACEYELFERISLDTVLSTLELAEKHNCSLLKKHCLKFVADKDNLFSLLLTEGYIKLMYNYPSLLAELKDLTKK